MKIEAQLCSLEQAKRLKELGVKQDSLWYWYRRIVNSESTMEVYPKWDRLWGRLEKNGSVERALSGESKNEIYSAFTVAELVEILKPALDSGDYTIDMAAPHLLQKYGERLSTLFNPLFLADYVILLIETNHLLTTGNGE